MRIRIETEGAKSNEETVEVDFDNAPRAGALIALTPGGPPFLVESLVLQPKGAPFDAVVRGRPYKRRSLGRSGFRTVGLWAILIILFVAFYEFFSRGSLDVAEPSFSEFMQRAENGQVKRVLIRDNVYAGQFDDSKERFRLAGPAPDAELFRQLRDLGVDVTYERLEQSGSIWTTILAQWFPVVVLFLVLIVVRQRLVLPPQ